ncbi:heme anaerobic degradation radical SAM methyltransferase ChuW/HutW, partial [Candidatus Falkowbacteria bacterium]|nr:heme anaerobic degradation radical SAM methyltransferase ChuW/HutW [Candidatus Falkowbacteria bacterium]
MAEAAARPRGAMALQAAAAGDAPIEAFFATIGADPLAQAFPGKRATHPFTGMSPVPQGAVEQIWAQLHDTARTARAVAYLHVPFCENHCHFCGFYQN